MLDMLTATAFEDHASRQILLGSPLGEFLERLLTLRADAGPRMTGGGRGVSPSALLRSLLAIGGGELDFKLMDLIPLGISSPALRYRQKFLQATVGRNRWWCIHGAIIPSLERCSPARQKAAGRPDVGRPPSSFAAIGPWHRFAMTTRALWFKLW
jgi:hypothetical protein